MKIYPYFDAQAKYYEQLTEGMSEAAKKGFANACAHHMMPLMRTDDGWYMTRYDLIRDRKDVPVTDLIDNEGKWHYRVPIKET
jgi:hypothetical protein